jgi:hypothetical protein
MGEVTRESGGGRVVEGGLKAKLKPEVCSWLPKGSFIDWKHNKCTPDCDGRNVHCDYHPRYDPKINGSSHLPEYYI